MDTNTEHLKVEKEGVGSNPVEAWMTMKVTSDTPLTEDQAGNAIIEAYSPVQYYDWTEATFWSDTADAFVRPIARMSKAYVWRITFFRYHSDKV